MLQRRRRVLELLVLDELADQFPARIFAFVLLLGLHLLLHRQQLAALDVHERGGHHQKFARHFEVKLAHEVDVLHKLGGQFGEVDLINIDLLLPDEVKEQIERSFEDLELYFIFRHETAGNRRVIGAVWQRQNREKLDYPSGRNYYFRPFGGRSSMVEPQIVVLDVAGSSPVDHPTFLQNARF